MGDIAGGFHSLKDSTKKKKKKRRDHLAVGEDTGWRSVTGLVPGYLSYWLPWIPKSFPLQKHRVDCCGVTRPVTLEPGLKPPTLCFMLLCCIHYFFLLLLQPKSRTQTTQGRKAWFQRVAAHPGRESLVTTAPSGSGEMAPLASQWTGKQRNQAGARGCI